MAQGEIGHRQKFLKTTSFSTAIPVWNEMCVQSALHHIKSLSYLVKKLESDCHKDASSNGKQVEDISVDEAVRRARLEDQKRDLVRTVRFNVGKLWNAIAGSSNDSLQYIKKFGIREKEGICDLAVKVVFYAAVGKEVSLEHQTEMKEVTTRLLAVTKEVPNDATARVDEVEVDVDETREGIQPDTPANVQKRGHEGKVGTVGEKGTGLHDAAEAEVDEQERTL